MRRQLNSAWGRDATDGSRARRRERPATRRHPEDAVNKEQSDLVVSPGNAIVM